MWSHFYLSPHFFFTLPLKLRGKGDSIQYESLYILILLLRNSTCSYMLLTYYLPMHLLQGSPASTSISQLCSDSLLQTNVLEKAKICESHGFATNFYSIHTWRMTLGFRIELSNFTVHQPFP